MMRLSAAFILLTAPLFAEALSDPALCSRVRSHLCIGDPKTALHEVEEGLKCTPKSKQLLQAQIEALAALGQEAPMMDAWRSLSHEDPSMIEQKSLLETMAWGVLQRGAKCGSHVSKLISLLVAHAIDDKRAVELLVGGLRSSNEVVRGLAIELAQGRRDHRLQSELEGLLIQESSFRVRLGILRALGRMKITSARPILERIVASPKSLAEERAIAIESLVNMIEAIGERELQTLMRSPRAGLRLLACEAIEHFGMPEHASYLFTLSQDRDPQVRATAIQALGLFFRMGKLSDRDKIEEIAQVRLTDLDPTTAISASWLLAHVNAKEGLESFSQWLSHPLQSVRLQAMAALGHIGRQGVPLVRHIFTETEDPWVRLNASLALLMQRVDTEAVSTRIAEAVSGNHERWMWKQVGVWRYIAPSTELHRVGVPNYPQAMNQLVRLELLGMLAILDDPRALPAVRGFLKKYRWGLSGPAAALLLTEGADDAFDVVAQLLDDRDSGVRLQAALVLGLLAGDSRATDTLQNAYSEVDRTQKEQILEALGKIGRPESLPFLIDRLEEPQQNLRIFAAGALLQCVNH